MTLIYTVDMSVLVMLVLNCFAVFFVLRAYTFVMWLYVLIKDLGLSIYLLST